MRAPPIVRLAVISVFVAASSLSGCGKDEVPTKPTPAPPTYPVLSSPQNVLSALEVAYPHRDSVETAALYDPSYIGTSEDLNDPPGTMPLSFHYADEVAHVATLARSSTISSVALGFGPKTSWTRLGSGDLSHPEWATIQISGSSINIGITDGTSMLETGGSNEFLEFLFKPSTPESGSPTDTLWKIVRWRESRQAGS